MRLVPVWAKIKSRKARLVPNYLIAIQADNLLAITLEAPWLFRKSPRLRANHIA